MIFSDYTKTLSLSLLFFSFLQTSSTLDAKVIEVAEEKELAAIFESKHDTIIMSTSDYCHWCTKTKPHFIELEEQYKSKVKFYSINYSKTKLQSFLHDFTLNGNHLTKETIKALKKQGALGINDTLHIPGNPTFLYIKHGKIVDIHIGGCDLETLEKFIKKNHK